MSNGLWSSNELLIPIHVIRPFFLQLWFILLVLLLTGSTVYFYYQRRIAIYSERQSELEELVQKRTKKISQDKQIIEQQAEELRSLERLKSRFFTNVSHELRTPLSLMLGPIQSLLKQGKQSNESVRLLQYAERNGLQLKKLINEILDLAKLESGKFETQQIGLHFYSYLKEQLAQFYSAATSNQKHLKLDYRFSKDLQLVLAEKHFSKILHNYLSNALKHTPAGTSIELILEPIDQQIRLSVKDEGAGIHPLDIPHIFDRFYQSTHGPDMKQGGSGIGLSICRELADLMEGKVWVESELGKGSTFYFQFPLNELEGNANISSIAPTTTNSVDQTPDPLTIPAAIPPKASRILLVEDHEDLRNFLSYLLQDYQLITAANGKEALDQLQSNAQEVDLIISDLMMPVMNGHQLLEAVKADPFRAHLPFLLLTAKVNPEDKIRALRIGVDDYLTKPFQEDELLARIENLLHNYQQRLQFFQEGVANKEEPDNEQLTVAATPRIAQVDLQWLTEVETTVAKHLADPRLKLDRLCVDFHLSERQFRRKLKSLTGLSPNHYLREARLVQARSLLETGRFATVKETAYAVGFKDSRYFSQQFQTRFGLVPSDYLK